MSADAERDRVVAWLRRKATRYDSDATTAIQSGETALADHRVIVAEALRQAADALSLNAHRSASAFEGDTPP